MEADLIESLDLEVYVREKPFPANPNVKANFVHLDETFTKLTVEHPYNRTPEETKNFSVTKVFLPNTTQIDIYETIANDVADALIGGKNRAIICYGHYGSGKTYTLFGKDNTKIEHKLGNYNEKTDTRGIMGRICHDIFAKFPSIEQKLDVVTSFYEVYQQRVRDLSRKFHPTMGGHASPTNTKKKFKTAGRRPSLSVLSSDNYEEEDMEVMDGTGGGVTIKHLCDWIVDSPETLADIYENGMERRESHENKSNRLSEFTHTIMTLSLQNKGTGVKGNWAGTLFLIDLAASSSSKTVGAKAGKDKSHYTDVKQVEHSFKVLKGIFNSFQKGNPLPSIYSQCKLTRVLKGVLAKNTKFTFIGHIVTNETYYDEAINTLTYLEGLRQSELGGKMGETMSLIHQENLLKKFNQENVQLKGEAEKLRKNHKKNFEELKEMIGLDLDLEKIVKTGSTQKEKDELTGHRNAMESADQIGSNNRELEHEVGRLEREMKQKRENIFEEQERNSRNYITLKESICKFMEQNKAYALRINEKRTNIRKQQDHELGLIESNSHAILMQSGIVMENIIDILAHTPQSDMKAMPHMKEQGKLEAQNTLTQNEEIVHKNHTEIMDRMIKKFEYYMKNKQNVLAKMNIKYKEFRSKSKQDMRRMNSESMELLKIYQKQSKILEYIEKGIYSNGMKLVKIPKEESPLQPTTSIFPLLHKTVQKKKEEESVPESKESKLKHTLKASIKERTSALELSEFLEKVERSSVPVRKSLDPKEIDLDADINSMRPLETIRYIDQLKEELRRIITKEKELNSKREDPSLLNTQTKLVCEIQKYQELYQKESMKNLQQRAMIDSQKHMIENTLMHDYTASKPSSLNIGGNSTRPLLSTRVKQQPKIYI